MLSLNYQITPWLKALVRSGMDVSNDQTQRRAPLGINSTRNWGGTDKGYYMEKNAYAFSMNNDFILSAEKSLDKLPSKVCWEDQYTTLQNKFTGSFYKERIIHSRILFVESLG
jgi:hypothetical protein